MNQRIDVSIPADVEAARVARQALDGISAAVPSDVLDDLRLLVSELVTNSVRHAHTDARASINLLVSVSQELIRVEVVDRGPGFEPTETPPSLYQSSGWGLYFVGEISDRWGVFRDSSTHVWFEFDVGSGERDVAHAG